MGVTVKFTLPCPALAKGDKVCLFKAWADPKVVADVGLAFTRKFQFTGSCVDAGGFNAVFSTIASQRLLPTPTKAFLPFTYHNYAMSRHYFGEDDQGEGSLGSTFAKSLTEDGIWDWNDPDDLKLPKYSTNCGGNGRVNGTGIGTSANVEYQWSSSRYPEVSRVLKEAKPHTFGSAGECRTVQDIKAMILNGYGVTFACNNYISSGYVVGSGDLAYVVGKWDTYGPHQQSIHAVWEHPTDGTLYWSQNNWHDSIYPKDPAGGPVCGVWVKERDVERALALDSEVFGLSHLNWFPANPDVPAVLDWSQI
jgi:hypothetical protein